MLTYPQTLYFCICILLSVALARGSEPIATEPIATEVNQIEIYPKRVFVSEQYPGRFIAIERLPDGSMVDRTRDVAAAFKAQTHAALSFSDEGAIRCSLQEHQAPSNFLAVTVIKGRRVSLEITAHSDAHAEPVFAREVSAILGKAGCNLGTCHGNLHGKGGFRLSLRGDDAEFDYASIVRGNSGRRIDGFQAAMSLMLTKPTGQIAHQRRNAVCNRFGRIPITEALDRGREPLEQRKRISRSSDSLRNYRKIGCLPRSSKA